MQILIIGLLLFIGIHLIGVVAPNWRAQKISTWGENKFKVIYSLVAVLGFVMIVWGYGAAQMSAPSPLWELPTWGRIANVFLMLVVFILLGAYHSKQSHIKVLTRHPMTWSVVVFCVAHLIVNNSAADALLFGGLLLWAIAVLWRAYGRDAAQNAVYGPALWKKTAINIAIGIALWYGFAKWLHPLLIGVAVMPS